MNDKEFQELLESYEKVVATGSNAYFDADDMLDIIDWYMEEERDADAYGAIRYAKHLHPNNDDIKLSEVRLRIYQGQYEIATSLITGYETKNIPEANLLACDILLHNASKCTDPALGDELVQAVEKGYEHALRQVDGDPGYYSSIISQHSREEMYELANGWISRALKLYPNYPAILDSAALCYALQGRSREAIDMANRLIDCDPYNARSWGILGDILHDFGDFTQSLEAYDYVKAIRPDERLSEQNMGDCHFALGHYDEAYHLYQSALAHYENSNIFPPPIEVDFIKSKVEICKIRLKEKQK